MIWKEDKSDILLFLNHEEKCRDEKGRGDEGERKRRETSDTENVLASNICWGVEFYLMSEDKVNCKDYSELKEWGASCQCTGEKSISGRNQPVQS